MKKRKVLLVLSSTETPERAIEFAVGRAKKEDATLVALYVLETGQVVEAFDRFTDIGFTGDRPSARLSESLMKEYRQRGYEELGRVQIKAMEEGVDFEPLMEDGPMAFTVLDVIERLDIDTAVVVQKKGRPLLKYFSRTPSDELKKKAPCEVIVLSE